MFINVKMYNESFKEWFFKILILINFELKIFKYL